VDQDAPDPKFDAMTARLLRREALRRAAEELNTTSGPGLEDMLARISAEVTAEATGARAANESRAQAHANSDPKASPDPATDPHGA
jgi:phage shock protein A